MGKNTVEEKRRAKDAPTPPIVVETIRKGAPAGTHDIDITVLVQGIEDRIANILFGHSVEKGSAIRLIREGLPLSSIERLRKTLKLETEYPVLDLVGVSLRTYQRRKKQRQNLDPIESDRLYRLAKIEARAVDVFKDEDIAVSWLKTPNRALGDKPMSLLDTEAGMEMVERVLTRIEHGVYS